MNRNELFAFFTERFHDVCMESVSTCYYDCYNDVNEDEYRFVGDDTGADWYACGCTKIVFYFKECADYVFKIPFFRSCHWDEDEEEYTDYYDYRYAGHEQTFSSACEEDDYCSVEVALYKEAENCGVEKAFAETFFLGYWDNVPVYASRYVKNNSYYSNHNFRATDEEEEVVEEILDNHSTRYPALGREKLIAAVRSYGVDFAVRLLQFITDTGIDDLHGNNVGWDKNDKFCIIDYAGYNECD